MLLNVRKPQNYRNVAVSLSQELAQSAVERDAETLIPELEIDRLRENGLLALVVPKEYGGLDATWPEALKTVKELSQGDGAIGQLYGNHLNLTALAHISGTPEQKARYYRQTAQHQWFWGNAINTWDKTLTITPDGDNFRLNGFTTVDPVVAAADIQVFSAWREGVEEPLFFILPRNREGVISDQQRDNLEQPQSEKANITFHNVLVKQEEILEPPNPPDSAFASFLGIIAQLTKTYVYLGIAESALQAAQEYAKTLSKPTSTSKGDSATPDSYILRQYGELGMELTTAMRLAEQAADIVQIAWEKESTLTHEENSEVAIAVFSAEAFATRVGWEIANCLFKLMESDSTATKYGFERYLRDLRTFGGVSMPWKGAPRNWKLTNFPPQLNSILNSFVA